MAFELSELKNIIEAVLMVAGKPLSVKQLAFLFDKQHEVSANDIKSVLQALDEEYRDKGIRLKEVAHGFRFQVESNMSVWVHKLTQERPPRYTRATLETLALIAYRQPITRGEIEDVRGVAVSTNIIRSLLEREWIKEVGHKDVPGRPALFGTTKQFLDDFNLKVLSELPPLEDLKDLQQVEQQFEQQLNLAVEHGSTEEQYVEQDSNSDSDDAYPSVELQAEHAEDPDQQLDQSDDRH